MVMDVRDSYADSYMYYSQDVDAGTNYPSNNGSGIKEDVARLSESASEDEHYYPHSTPKVECNQDSSSRVSNDDFGTKRLQDSASAYDGVPPVKKGRGRPKKVYDGVEIKEWSDEEIYKLIEIWGKHDVLYNCKHPLYHNKTEKSNAIETIRERLEEAGITANTRQICDKLTTLRNYYGAVKRKTDSLKRQGFEGEDAYFCRWQFYQPLAFLEGTFSPRQSEYHTKKSPYVMEAMSLMASDRSLPSMHTMTSQQVRPLSREAFDCPKEPIQQSQMSHLSPHSHSNQTCRSYLDLHTHQLNQATKLSRTIHGNQHNEQNNVTLATQSDHAIQGRLSNQTNHSSQPMHRSLPSPIQSDNNTFLDQSCQTPHHAYNTSDNKSEDQLFGEMVAKMISGISDLEAKALLLIRIQQDIVQTKFRTRIAFQKPRASPASWNNNYVNTQTKETNISHGHGYDAEQKIYRSIEHSPISSRSDSPISSPACTPKLDNVTSVNPEVIIT